ncbi:MAG: VOC family protein [Defluviitaleaceae bacterium]|nr:VOC family protein [Defluviitaleaceae bacterium]
MKTSIVINFNGQGQEALKMYAEVFGLESPKFITYGSLPPSPDFVISDEEKDYIFQASINIGGLDIMIQDLLKSMHSQFNNSITISVSTQNESDVKKWFEAMEHGGQITCPMQPMPWSQLYGAVKDKFGTSWQFQLI